MTNFTARIGRILRKIFSFLRARAKIGSLVISDTSLQFSYFNGDAFETAGLRLPPGIVENGEIKNYEQFIEALKALRGQTLPWFSKRGFASVIVTLGSSRVYTQVFSLPAMKEENLEEAIKLNVKMISPFEASQAYAGWQFVNQVKDASKLDVLSAFASKEFVDWLGDALKQAGFLPIALESGALSLARLVRERAVGFNPDASSLAVSVDNRGLQFLILRRGQLYFEYYTSWQDIQGSGKEISWQDLAAAIKRSLRQVLNFYGTHWSEPLMDVFIATESFGEEIAKVIAEDLSLNVKPLELKFGQPIRRDWFEAAGAALRAAMPRADDKEINLFGVTVQEEFLREEVVAFLKFWQVMMPASLGILFLAFVGSHWFLSNLESSLKAQSFAASGRQSEEITALQSDIAAFNREVAMIAAVQSSSKRKNALLEALAPLIGPGKATLNRIDYGSNSATVSLNGEADSQDQILAFKNALATNPMFDSVNLPLSDIQQKTNGFFFAITFVVK